MELTQEQIAAAQAQINSDIEELAFEETPFETAIKSVTYATQEEPSRSDLLEQEMNNQQNIGLATIGGKTGVSAAIIKALEVEYKGLTVTGVKDKDGIQVLKDAISRVKTMKRNIETTREDLKRPILEAGRALDSEARELTAGIDGVLKPLIEEQAKVDKMIDDERFAVQREQEKLMNDRVAILKENGATLQGVFYCVGESISITPDVLKTMEQEEFTKLLAKVEHAKTLESLRKAKEDAEKAGLQTERDALDKQKKALLDSRVSVRESIIKMLGYTPKAINPGIFDLISEEFPDVIVNLTYDHLEQYDDAAFMKYLEQNKERFDAVVKGRRALKLKDDRIKERGKVLENHGLTWDYTKDCWSYDNRTVVVYRATVYDLDDAAFEKVAFDAQDAIVKAELKKQEDDKKKEERLKLEQENEAANRLIYLPALAVLNDLLIKFENTYGHIYGIIPDSIMGRIDHLTIRLRAEFAADDEPEDDERGDFETGLHFEEHM